MVKMLINHGKIHFLFLEKIDFEIIISKDQSNINKNGIVDSNSNYL